MVSLQSHSFGAGWGGGPLTPSPEVFAQLLLMGKQITSQAHDALAQGHPTRRSCFTFQPNGFLNLPGPLRGKWSETLMESVTGALLDVNWPAGIPGLSVHPAFIILHSVRPAALASISQETAHRACGGKRSIQCAGRAGPQANVPTTVMFCITQ